MIQRVAVAIKPYLTVYYAFIAGIGVGIPIGSLVASYVVKLLIDRFS